ncbi:BAAT/Acyl-CoA thioester hydrolase [Streptomyces lincolnensis]|uniref:BAAT/Acyl-CoA thioester hydrolase n=1 Tax=Streptomyces lincolnensis TaxID=1915 RepID=A0A1B1M1J9_STRLN|nr:acyl-CoA thioester hydrolase/BAAT C-terminal domain-containing protein [Streptomyces lincolnensis]ANS62526.1 BAAT/Acyl-CoA thioester hydrolase [Streptomyces lincolnensis]AXG51451.1 BAAT/Acyl-CoA thioester hydrolase [Streptomyces lincolnensis]QMV04504.1 acyl-CoA thioesterase [Streptomyces lincolnensis]QMV11820.1 acyl-CoA thioesterase [Streptomyces lincolnensis]
MDVVERELTDPWEGVVVTPAHGSAIGVLVLAGSSGRVERERAHLLARQGVTAMSIRWFGGPGQPPGICEVPLETFTEAVDLLRASGAERIGILGASKGAEAALLTAVHDPRVDVVVAVSPPSRVWCNIGAGSDGEQRPYRSSWTWRGRPVPFVPMDDSWSSPAAPVAIRGWYELSERTYATLLPAARIPVERARADLLLVAGGDDEMWPSLLHAERLARRRRSAAAPVRLISRPDAGHRPRFPGESPAPASPRFRYGGTPEADALLGAAAWPHVLGMLRGGSGP